MEQQTETNRIWRGTLVITLTLIALFFVTRYFIKYVDVYFVDKPLTNKIIDASVFSIVEIPLIYYLLKRSARYIREANDKFAMLVRQNLTGIFICQNQQFKYVNPKFAEMMGYAKAEFQSGKVSLRDIIEPEFLPVLNDCGDDDTHLVLKCRTSSGKIIWLEVYVKHGTYQKQPAAIVTAIDRTESKEVEEQLIEEQQRYRALFDNNPIAIYALDRSGVFTDMNPVGPRVTGRTLEELIGTTFMPYIVPDDLPKAMTAFQGALSGKSQNLELKVIHRTGSHVDLRLIVIPYRVHGEIAGAYAIAEDITYQNKQKAFLIGQKQILEMVAKSVELDEVLAEAVRVIEQQIEGSMGHVYIMDKETNRLVLSFGPKLIKENFSQLDIALMAGSCAAAARQKEPVIVEDICTDERYATIREAAIVLGFRACWSVPILGTEQEVLGTFSVSFMSRRSPSSEELDLAKTTSYLLGLAIERKQNEQYVEHLAYYDALTNLPNRRLFYERLSQACDDAKRNNQRFAVMYVDVDRFKQINDSFGHDYGDVFLSEVARRLTTCVRETDMVARMSGDEFTLIISPVGSVNDLTDIANRMLRTFSDPFTFEGRKFSVTPSIGIALYPDDANDPLQLVRLADAAMYAAKSRGKNTYQLYDPSVDQKHYDILALYSAMSRALENNEFILQYQPRVNAQTGQIVSAEALIRWNHPTRGIIPPSEFIHLAEETDFIVELGKWVIHESCRQNKRWHDDGHPPIRVAVNVSGSQLLHNHIVETVSTALAETGLDAHYLELEITERTLVKHEQTVLGILENLHELGVHIAIDDFGTGYSSLSYLRQFKVDTLKIDRSFVSGLPNNPDDVIIADTIIHLAHSLNLNVVAEGVETEAQRSLLKAKQCDELQGFLVGRPVPADALFRGDV